jgi:CDP-diacylglycerol---glycerol-3-phosphate 3-phosphatidyltransferase
MPNMRAQSLVSLVRGAVPLKLPLLLTLGRIFISPIFLILYLYYPQLGINLHVLPFLLIGLLALSELSDFLDGYLARKFNLVTDLGKILDPMADSITRLTILMTLTQGLVQLPLLLVFVFIYRDTMISTLRTICALRGMTLAARLSGKIKTALQGVVIFLILFLMIAYTWSYISLKQLQIMSFFVVSISALYTLYSGIEYIYANRHYIREVWLTPK